MLRSLTVGMVLLGLACAAPQQDSPGPDLSLVRAQLDSLWAEYAAAAIAGNADAIVRLYTDSAYLVESGLPTVRGNGALRSVVKDVLSGVRFLESSIRPELTEVVGDRVLQFGEYRDVLQPTGKPVQVVVGRFAAVLERDSTASWRVSRLIAVADSTVPQRATPK
jgi:ketosteroid isomerase-like protein